MMYPAQKIEQKDPQILTSCRKSFDSLAFQIVNATGMDITEQRPTMLNPAPEAVNVSLPTMYVQTYK